MLKSFKFRLYPNKGQEILINKHLGSNRFIYNYFLDKRINTYKETKQILTYNQCSALLPQLKKELEWLKEVDSKSLQQTLINLDMAYQNFLERSKKEIKITDFQNLNLKKIITNHIELNVCIAIILYQVLK